MTEPAIPPTPPPASKPTIDFAKPFTFVFEDPGWLAKVAIGGLVYLLAFLLIGIFFILGYSARLARNVASGVSQPLPEWDAWGEDLAEGAMLFFIVILYYTPLILIMFLSIGGSAILGASSGEGDNPLAAMAGGVFGLGICFLYGIMILVMVILPAAITLAVMRRSFAAAFDFATIFAYMKENAVNYVLSIVVYIAAGFIAQLGFILLCIGVLFTSFWAQLVTTHAFAQTYRLSRIR